MFERTLQRTGYPSPAVRVGEVVRSIALALFAAATLQGCVSSERPRDLATEVRERVNDYASAGDFMGVVAIGQSNQEPLLLPFGDASVELRVPHSGDGVFMIGSISKQFTAAALLTLESEGKLRLADPISQHLSEFEDAPAEGATSAPTIHQLLNHTAGIGDTYSLPMFGSSRGLFGDFEEVVDALAKAPRTHAPGTTYAYSNGGYVLAAAIIERVSGVSYGEFLSSRFFEPLDLTSMRHNDEGAAQVHEVPGYQPWSAFGVSPVERQSSAFAAGAGSLWSNAVDLFAWTRALHGGVVLPEESYARLVTDYGNGYGYGLSVFRRFDQRVYGHDGRIAGYATDPAHYPDADLTIVVLSNVESVARDAVRVIAAAALAKVLQRNGAAGSLSSTAASRRPRSCSRLFSNPVACTGRMLPSSPMPGAPHWSTRASSGLNGNATTAGMP